MRETGSDGRNLASQEKTSFEKIYNISPVPNAADCSVSINLNDIVSNIEILSPVTLLLSLYPHYIIILLGFLSQKNMCVLVTIKIGWSSVIKETYCCFVSSLAYSTICRLDLWNWWLKRSCCSSGLHFVHSAEERIPTGSPFLAVAVWKPLQIGSACKRQARVQMCSCLKVLHRTKNPNLFGRLQMWPEENLNKLLTIFNEKSQRKCPHIPE